MVFPLWDDNPFTTPKLPYVTWTLIVLNLLAFVATVSASEPGAVLIFATFAAVPAEVTGGAAPDGILPSPLTLLTCTFLHGSWAHLLGNMVYLWVFGDDIERCLGRLRFLAFYLAGGAGAALGFVLLYPASTAQLVGASGAVSAILAAYLMLRPCAKVTVFVFRIVIRVRAFWPIGLWVALQLYSIVTDSDGDVAYAAHLVGLALGAVLFFLLRPAGTRLFECVRPAPLA